MMLIKIKGIYYLKLVISIMTQDSESLVRKKRDTIDTLNAPYEDREIVLHAFSNISNTTN